ncbi:MAG TPA: 4-alpha-glucanotransferase [Streptosporangiaceae bacterium]|nr:4-alpha-glucanotransferase [Streptosporangiaceae bacterium]
MTDAELIRRAEAAGIAPWYRDWREQRVDVSDATLAAILAALDRVPSVPEVAVPEVAVPEVAVAPADIGGGRPRVPAGRSWGLTVQLYSVRSRASWGHGDLHDLTDLAVWSARDLQAGFILINPLHAAEPLPPVSPSPYLPMTRRFISPLYLRVEDIPEFGQLDGAQRERIEALAAPLRVRNATADLIDRDAVWAAKRAALEIIHQVPLSDRRREAYERFRREQGRDLADWAQWCALAERHGPDWRSWPKPLRQPRRAADDEHDADDAHAPVARSEDFHAWLQWHAGQQLAAAQRSAVAAGMRTGIITDLAVGVHPGGADAWAHQDLLVGGLSVGAPPDEFNQRGQDWSQPPWHPRRLAEAGYRPLADLFGAALRHAGGLRVDHVMGLMRLWCIPQGMPPDRGAYIRYDHRASVAALTSQAGRAGAVAIGEDLGTVDEWIRDYLAASEILGTTMLWFAREPDGTPLAPAHWRRNCMATVGTHDVPPVAAFRTGEQVTVRARLGLLKISEESERAAAGSMLDGWRDALVREGLIPPGPLPGPDEFTVALYGYLARTASVLVGVSLADAVGDRRAQNLPGTSSEYPNWQIPLCDADGHAMLLEDLPGSPLVTAVCAAAAGRLP